MYFNLNLFKKGRPALTLDLPVRMELMAGVEPATSSLPRMRSTTELHQQHELLFATTRIYECINKK